MTAHHLLLAAASATDALSQEDIFPPQNLLLVGAKRIWPIVSSLFLGLLTWTLTLITALSGAILGPRPTDKVAIGGIPFSFPSPPLPASESASVDYTAYVDPFLGTLGGGNIFPGATLPHGVIKFGADTLSGSRSALSGWTPTGNVTAFSVLHESGTGGTPKYGVVAQMPLLYVPTSSSSTGVTDPAYGFDLSNNASYARKRTQPDVAHPGYFRSRLDTTTTVELSATQHAGIVRYTQRPAEKDVDDVVQPMRGNGKKGKGNQAEPMFLVLVDASHFLPAFSGEVKFTQTYQGSTLRIDPSTGSYNGSASFAGGWNRSPTWTIHFCASFDTAPKTAGTFGYDYSPSRPVPPHRPVPGGATSQVGNATRATGAIFAWPLSKGKQRSVVSRIAVSFVSVERACAYKRSELPHDKVGLDDVVTAAKRTWNDEVLSSITLPPSSSAEMDNVTEWEEKRGYLYTSLYHHAVLPSNRTEDAAEPSYDDFYTIWDCFRSAFALTHLLDQSRYIEILRSLVRIYKTDGFFPDGRSNNYNGRTQGGSNADNLFGDAWSKGLGKMKENGLDWQEAYAGMKKDAEVVPPNTNDSDSPESSTKEGRGALPDWLQYGYITPNYTRSVSRTAEYATNDYALAIVASGLNTSTAGDAQKYLSRSRNWRNIFNPTASALGFHGFATPRAANGSWLTGKPVTEEYITDFAGYWGDYAYEATLWEYTFSVPHDVAGLIEATGGQDEFIRRLDTTFEKGLVNIGNEPSFLTSFLYNYVPGKQHRAVAVNQGIVRSNYSSGTIYPGNTDAGALPAYLIWQYMGLYPVVPSPIYLLTAPHFPSLSVRLTTGSQPGATLNITTHNLTSTALVPSYVQSVTLDGTPLTRAWVHHDEIRNGANLVFNMGPDPVPWDAAGPPPPSSSINGTTFTVPAR